MRDVELARGAVRYLRTPASSDVVAVRINALLSHYFVPVLETDTARVVAGDWIGILDSFPLWAIDRACKRWLSGKDCKRKPLPGDILKFTETEMFRVQSVKYLALETQEQIDQLNAPVETAPEPLTVSKPKPMAKSTAPKFSLKNNGMTDAQFRARKKKLLAELGVIL